MADKSAHDRNAQRSRSGKEAMQTLSAGELVARVAELLPDLTANELDDLADAVENLTDAIAFTIETAASDDLEGESGVSALDTP